MMRRIIAITFGILISCPGWAQISGGIIATGSTAARTPQDRFAERINIRDFGAKGNALSYADGIVTSGTNTLTSATATFTAADVGKTIQIDGAGPGGIIGAPLVTTISGFNNANSVTISANASTTTPLSWLSYVSDVPTGEAAGNYQPGDVMSVVGGTSTVTATVKVTKTSVFSASVNAAGSGGTNGACVLNGTTGVGTKFQINSTITGNAISSLGSFTNPGHYFTNPTTTGEPVTGCGLSGATLNLVMGVDKVSIVTPGNYTATPSNPVATTAGSISGATGATLTVATWQATGGFIYATDDGPALAAAVTKAVAQGNAGRNVVIYAPTGAYYIGSTTIPTFFGSNQSGGVIGEGHALTQFIVGAAHVGDLFSWSEAWYDGKNAGPFDRFSPDTGPKMYGFSVFGDLFASAQQNAIMLYDREDRVYIEDVQVGHLNGRCFLSGILKNTIQSWMRESSIRRFTCFNAGQPGVPPFEFNTQGGGNGTNEIEIDELNIYAPYDNGFVIRNNGTGGIGTFRINQLRVEGQEPGIYPLVAGNLIQIGDPAMTGPISGITFENIEAISPYPGYADFLVTANSIATQPFQISVESGLFTGGSPSGMGLNIQYGRSLYFHLTGISSQDYNITVAPTTQTGGPILIDLNRSSDWSGVTTNIDPSAVNNIFRPIYQNGFWLTEPPGPGTQPIAFNATPNGGSPAMALQTLSTTAFPTYTGGLTINSAAGGLFLKGSPVTINGAVNQAVNIGTGSNTSTVTLGGGSNGVTLNGSTNIIQGITNINVGNNAATNIGTGSTTSNVNIGGGSDNIIINSNATTITGVTSINASNNANTNIGTGSTTNTVTIGGGSNTFAVVAGVNMNVSNNQGTNIGTGTTTSNVNIGGGSNSVIIGSPTTITGATSINANNNAATNIGTGTTTSAVNMGGGSNTVTLNGAGITVTGPVSMNVSNNAVTNIGTGTTTSNVNIGGGSSTVSINDATNINVSNNHPTNIGTGTTTSNVNIGGGANAINIGANGGTNNILGVTNINVSNNQGTNIATGTTTSNVAIANGTGNNSVSIGNGTGKVTISGPLISASGTQFTVASGTGACATSGTLNGGVQAGDLTCTGSTGASTVTLTLVATTTAYTCWGRDITNPTTVTQTGAKSTTSVTLTLTSVTANDVIQFGCLGY